MNKYICFHGHFYQPPREDPWLEVIEFQKDASPYHDWNDYIAYECYGPNRAARRVDGEGKILEIINNYEFINFNFGPTLLSWLKKYKIAIYQKIVEADIRSRKRFGFGNAIAQVYNHVIMPLANRRDKLTQISWGIEAFKYHFGRLPLGMWLAETAVDNETLAVLASSGIKFTILSPKQAKKVRLFDGNWQTVNEAHQMDTTHPYRCFPEPGLAIDIFFYHEEISRGIAFGNLLKKGELLAEAIESAFLPDESRQIISIAADGETYGHHHKFGEMGLAYNIDYFMHHSQIKLTNYSQILSLHQPEFEVIIKEKTAWSCNHGVGRWYRDCGCRSGIHPGWQQGWRKPLREGFELLRKEIDPPFEKSARRLLKDLYSARNDYIHILLDSGGGTKEAFLARHRKNDLSEQEKSTLFKMLEMQYYGQLIFTSCAWYFDDISGIEARQNIFYAARLIQLAKEMGMDLKEAFLQILKGAKSNLPQYGDGAKIYENLISSRLYDLKRLSAHYAFDHILNNKQLRSKPFYTALIDLDDYATHESSGFNLIFISLRATHLRSLESEQNLLSVLHLGDMDIVGGIVTNDGIKKQLLKKFNNLDFFGVKSSILALPHHYEIKDLLLDGRREVVQKLVEKKLLILKNNYLLFYEGNKGFLYNLNQLKVPISEAFLTIIKSVLQEKALGEVERLVKGEKNVWKDIKKESKRWGVDLGTEAVRGQLKEFIEKGLRSMKAKALSDSSPLRSVTRALSLYYSLFSGNDLWEVRNLTWEILSLAKEEGKKLPKGFIKLEKTLGFKVAQ